VLDIEKIVSDVMSFPGCRVAVYLNDRDGETLELSVATGRALESAGASGVKISPASMNIWIHGGGQVCFRSLIGTDEVGTVYSSYYDSEANIPIGQHDEIMRSIKACETQKKPDESKYVITSKEYAALSVSIKRPRTSTGTGCR